MAGLSITTGLLTVASLAAIIAANTWNPGSPGMVRSVAVVGFWLLAGFFAVITMTRAFTGIV